MNGKLLVALLSLIVAILAFATPEIRCFVGLEPKPCFKKPIEEEPLPDDDSPVYSTFLSYGPYTFPPVEDAPEEPVNVVRGYYEDLNRNDANSALSKRVGVKKPQKVRNLVRGVDWFEINDIKFESFFPNSYSPKSARVWVNVRGKRKKKRAERWEGTIDLEKIGNEWKISSLNGLERKE